MLASIFNTFFYNPLYNGLIFLVSIVPLADVGIAIIILTVIVKLLLFPLSRKAIRAQMVMKEIEPEMRAIKEKNAKDKQEQARLMMSLYREKKINPFSSIGVILLQFPVIIALYWVFFKGGLPDIDPSTLYSYVSIPTRVNMEFLGLIDMSGRSIVLAVLAGATQFIHIRMSQPPVAKRADKASLQEDFMRSMQLQMRYGLPFIVFIFSYIISAAIALYWLTSNIVSIGQEYIIRRNKPNI